MKDKDSKKAAKNSIQKREAIKEAEENFKKETTCNEDP